MKPKKKRKKNANYCGSQPDLHCIHGETWKTSYAGCSWLAETQCTQPQNKQKKIWHLKKLLNDQGCQSQNLWHLDFPDNIVPWLWIFHSHCTKPDMIRQQRSRSNISCRLQSTYSLTALEETLGVIHLKKPKKKNMLKTLYATWCFLRFFYKPVHRSSHNDVKAILTFCIN